MLAFMDICMGGRVAEEIVYGAENVTSGKPRTLTALHCTALIFSYSTLFILYIVSYLLSLPSRACLVSLLNSYPLSILDITPLLHAISLPLFLCLSPSLCLSSSPPHTHLNPVSHALSPSTNPPPHTHTHTHTQAHRVTYNKPHAQQG